MKVTDILDKNFLYLNGPLQYAQTYSAGYIEIAALFKVSIQLDVNMVFEIIL